MSEDSLCIILFLLLIYYMPCIYVDVHLKTIPVVSLFSKGCCQKREFAANRLPVKFQDVKLKDPKSMKFS